MSELALVPQTPLFNFSPTPGLASQPAVQAGVGGLCCPTCGNLIEQSPNGRRKYCSSKCKSAHDRKINPEYFKEKSRGYYIKLKKNPKAWFVLLGHKNKIRMASKRLQLREMLYDKFDRRCGHCGFNDTRALQIDHVNGGGKNERKKYRNAMNRYYEKVLADTNGEYQLLCANCNWIKRFTNKEIHHLNQHKTPAILARYPIDYEI